MTLRTPAPLRPAHRARRRLVGVAVAVVLAPTLLGACGDDERSGAPASTSTAAPTTTATTRAGPGNVVADCGDAAGPCVPDAPTSAPTSAPTTDTTSTPGAPGRVLVDSVTTSTTGPWRALGMVQAAGSGPAQLVVVATLVGSGGQTLTTVEADALVSPAPSGVAVPFEVASDTASDQVTDVRWEVRVTGVSPVPALTTQVFWTRPFGEARPIALPSYVEPPDGPFPYVLYSGVTASGSAPVALPGVVAAWQGPDGRVLAVANAPALEAGTDRPASSLAPGAALDAVLVVDDPVAGPQLADATPILWGVSR